jgi:predicted  nucleic acid-binding Zn-ribbon protein
VADVSNELIYELLKKMQTDISSLNTQMGEVRQELSSIRYSMMGVQNDIHNIYGILGRHDDRLDRIERRLELNAFAEPPQAPYKT